MKIDNIFPAAILSVQAGVSTAREAAAEIARHQTTDKTADVHDMANSLVQLKRAENHVEAGVFIIKTADELLGGLIDIRA